MDHLFNLLTELSVDPFMQAAQAVDRSAELLTDEERAGLEQPASPEVQAAIAGGAWSRCAFVLDPGPDPEQEEDEDSHPADIRNQSRYANLLTELSIDPFMQAAQAVDRLAELLTDEERAGLAQPTSPEVQAAIAGGAWSRCASIFDPGPDPEHEEDEDSDPADLRNQSRYANLLTELSIDPFMQAAQAVDRLAELLTDEERAGLAQPASPEVQAAIAGGAWSRCAALLDPGPDPEQEEDEDSDRADLRNQSPHAFQTDQHHAAR
ncbi:hypothetical protein [Sorangium sp. So ce513]|uniref:hypothetical protein n=1 Tax=Sorangium sp. So ce513 TaxID=3133315 RepID=UPI003F60B062